MWRAAVSDRVNVGDAINTSAIRPIQILVLALGIALALVDGYDTQTVAYALTSMATEWNVKPQAFAPALIAGLFGLMVGGMIMGQLGDKFGRKPMAIVATVIFGACTIAIAYIRGVDDLFWVRFVAGIGLGGVLPNVTTIVADYAPERRRRTAVMIIIGSLAAGAFLGGVLAAHMIPAFGWRSIFIAGGAVSFVMAVVCIALLSESPLFLAAQNGSDPRIGPILRRIAPALSIGPNTQFFAHMSQEKRASPARLFAAGRAPITTLLWTSMVAQLILVYLFSLWLPTLARENGNPVEVSLFASALFSLGGLAGSLLLGPISERMGPYLTLSASYVLVALMSMILSISGTNVALLYSASFLVGVVAFGTWSALTALITKYYPPEIRATGVGYGSGIGRFGSMLSPWFVGLALASGWKAPQILLLPIAPALVAAGCVVAIGILCRRSADGEGSFLVRAAQLRAP
jgi:MFS transporter, AAHS family, 4-hydroxybenzoate transporter